MKSPRDRRIELGLHQRDIAKAAGVACSSISRFECGEHPMNKSTKKLILAALERLETEQLARMCAEDQNTEPQGWKKPIPAPTLQDYDVAPAVFSPLPCRACAGTGIVWGPDGRPWKCPYCGGAA